jgi:hypothetical protein
MVVKISSEVAVRPAQLSIFILGVAVGFSKVIDFVSEVLQPGTSLTVRSAVVLKVFSKASDIFMQLCIHAAEAFVVQMKVLIVVLKAFIGILKALVGISKALILPSKLSILSILGEFSC